MTGKRRPLRALLLLGGAIAFSLFISYATPLHRTLFRLGTRAFGIEGGFESSRIFLLFGRLSLKNVSLRDSHGKFHLEASRLHLSVSPLSLLRGKLIVSRFTLEDGALRVKTGEPSKRPPDPDLLKKFFLRYENSLLLRNLSIRTARLRNFSLRFGDPRLPPWEVGSLTAGLESTLFRELKGKILLEGLRHNGPVVETLGLAWSLKPEELRIDRIVMKREGLDLSGKVEWRGTLQKGSLRVEGAVFPPNVLDEPVRFHLDAGVSNQVAETTRLSATLGTAALEGEGRFNLKSNEYQLRFRAADLPLESIFHKLPGTLLSKSSGIAGLEGRATGRFPKISAEADATITRFRHRDLGADRATGKIRLDWPTLSFEAHIQSREGGPEVGQVTGSVAFLPLKGEKKLKAQPRGIEVVLQKAPLEEILPEGRLKGLLSGSLSLRGVETSVQGKGKAFVEAGMIRSFRIESLESEVSVFPEGRLAFAKSTVNIGNLEPIHFPSPLHLDTSGERIRFEGTLSPQFKVAGSYDPKAKLYQWDRVEWKSTAGTLNVSGTVNETLHLKVQGKTDLVLLKIFPEVINEASGAAAVNGAVTGSAEDPDMEGTIELSDAALELRGLPYSVSRLKGDLRLVNHRIRSRLEGNYGDGRFQLGGELTLDRLRADLLDLQLTGSSIVVRRGRDLFAELNGNVTLKGKWPSPRLAGQIDLVDGRYTREFEIRDFVLKPITGREERHAKPAAWDPVELSLHLKSAGDLEIKNNLARMHLSCDLFVSGTTREPKFRGNFELIDGTFDYFAKAGRNEERQFLLTEGRMVFADSYRNETHLLIRGEGEIPPEYLVSLKIEGYLDNLAIALTSVPSRSREDILSLIAFGVTRDELELTGGFGGSLGRQIAVREVSRPFEGIFSRTLGVDVEVEQSSVGELSPTRLSVGREVTDRLTIEVKSDFAPQVAERTVQANYYLTDNILLKGFRSRTATTAPHYQFNLSLRFRVR